MIAFRFYIKSLESLAPKESSLLGSIEPLSAVLTTVFWLNEPFGFFQWLGTACLIGMIILLALNKSSSEKKANKTARTRGITRFEGEQKQKDLFTGS
ncbi:drug/metabolite transporter (DMT)-like permease [Scopulibacillus daqui]|uniref:Drug/metabolite transporter (DMT)-like permease n=1 Tax=Scopulibacillus daqui TaxID=1469162 RepID=A0ABS2Q0W6_9BACL|nr:drug/metabolite transporter (DMT)-like permease [Scopulibacillus daqui]